MIAVTSFMGLPSVSRKTRRDQGMDRAKRLINLKTLTCTFCLAVCGERRTVVDNGQRTSAPIWCACCAEPARYTHRLNAICIGSRMLNPKLIEELAAKLATVAANTPAAEIDKNLRALLGTALGRLDLVTREEFDVQCAVLAQARERISELEARVAELEQRAKPAR
jgi:BMFP domain-containing protein YqiC